MFLCVSLVVSNIHVQISLIYLKSESDVEWAMIPAKFTARGVPVVF